MVRLVQNTTAPVSRRATAAMHRDAYVDSRRTKPTYGRSTNVTFSAISATRFAIRLAMISKGEAPCCGTGGVCLATAAVLETGFLTNCLRGLIAPLTPLTVDPGMAGKGDGTMPRKAVELSKEKG